MFEPHLKVLQPNGYITAANVAEFQEILTETVQTALYQDYLIDMQGVEFLDSAGLMALVSSFRMAQTLGKRLNICSLAPSVRIIFEITQLDKVIPIYESREGFFSTIRQPLAA